MGESESVLSAIE